MARDRAGGVTRERLGRQHGELFVMLVRRQIWLRRKRSWLARIWPVLSPFLLTVLYTYVFRRVFRVPVARYPDYLLCGLLPWAFLTASLNRAAASVSGEADILRKAPIPAELLPLTAVATYAIDLLITVAVLVGWLAVEGELHAATLPAVALPLVAVVALVAGLATLIALIDVYSHDLRQVLGNILTVWFFLVPIVYRPNMAPESARWLRSVDPLSLIVTQMRDVLYFGRLGSVTDLVVMVIGAMAVLAMAVLTFRHFATDLAKDV